MSSSEFSGALGGAAQGAQAGAIFGPIGAGIGAAFGGIAGAFSGSSQHRAQRLMKKANKLDYQRRLKQSAIQRRDMIREYRMTRALMTATAFAETGGSTSSTTQAGLGSFGSQFSFNRAFFDEQAGMQKQIGSWTKKAGKAASNAEMISGTIGLVAGVATSIGGAVGSLQAYNAQASSNLWRTTNATGYGMVKPSGTPVGTGP